MANDGVIMKNEIALKPYSTAPATKDSAIYYIKNLNDADDVMMTWMNNFNPDFTGKTHEVTMTYLSSQKVQLVKINSRINSAIAASNKYLTNIKTK